MSSVPGSGIPGSTAAGAVGGQVTPGIPDNTKPITKPDAPANPDSVSSSIINNTETKSGSNPSDLEEMPQRVSNQSQSLQTPGPTLKQDTLPPQYDEKAYQSALSSYNQKQQTIQSLNEQLALVTPKPVSGRVYTPKGYTEQIIGYVYNDNTPASPNDQRAIQAQQLKMQIKGIQDTLGSQPLEENFPNPEYAKAKSYQDLPAGAKLYHAYVINNQGLYQETGTGNEYQDALVKAADLGINIKLDADTLVNSKGVDLRGASGLQTYVASLVNQISAFGKPTTYDNGGLISYNYNESTKTLEVKGTNELAINRENATRVGLPGGGLGGGGPETPESKAYESAGVSFGQSAVAPGSLSRGPNDIITQATKDIASALASKDVSSGIAPKGDTYGGLASFAGEGSSNPIVTPGPVVNQVKQNKLELPPSPTGGLVQLQPKQEETITPEIIPTFQNVLSTKDQGKGTPSQVEFKDLNPGLQSLVSGGLGGNETSIGGIQEFLKTHDYSKLTGQLPTEEIKQNNLVPGISIEEQQSQALGAGLASLSEQQQLAKYQSNALGVGLLSLSQEQQISKAQSQGLGAGLMDISNQQKEQKIITSNQLSEQQFINAKVNNAIDRLAYEGDLITSAKNAGAKTIDVFGVETDLGSVFPAKGKTANSFDVFGAESSKLVPLESIPVSKASELLPSILDKYKGKEIQLGYTPAPIASPGPGATLEYQQPSLFENIAGRPATAIADVLADLAIGTGAMIYSLPYQFSKDIEPIFKGQVPGLFSGSEPPKEAQAFEKEYLSNNPISSGISGIIEGKGLSGFVTEKGPEYDIPYLIGSAGLLVLGGKGIVPLKYTEAVLEKGQGLTEDIPLYKAVTLGYSEGGSKYILVGKSPEGKIIFGTPKPEDYIPQYSLPLKESGRGFTGSEGGGLLNHLMNRQEVLDYYVKENIITPYDVSLFNAVKEATPIIVESPVKIFHPDLGPQPLETVLQGKETDALKDIIKTGQKENDLGPQYGSFGDIPFVPGKVNVGDLDLAVNSVQHQEEIGLLAESKLNEVAGIGRSFKFEEGGVYLYQESISGRTKIIDLPIKGLNEEGGQLAGNTYNKVFGVKEPEDIYKIEGIEIKTPHYNTLRRSTTLTRIGSKNIRSNIPGFGLTTKYGNYIGPEFGRLKDAARVYRGYILGAKAFRETGNVFDLIKAEKLERSALIIKNRFQHVYNFEQALEEVKGETIINESPKTNNTSSLQSLLKNFKTKEKALSVVSSIESINESSIKSISKNSSIEKLIKNSSSSIKEENKPSEIKTYSPSRLSKQSQSKINKVKGSNSSIKYTNPKSNLSSVLSSPNNSEINSSLNLSEPSLSSPSIPSTNPNRFSILIPNRPETESIPFVPENPRKKKEDLLFEEHKRKIPKNKSEKADRKNFLGNAPEFDIVGIYKRNEIVYGNSTISRLTAQDTSNTNKKYSEKYQTGKEKILFTEGGKTIKVKGSTTKPKSFQEKFKKKLKI